MPRLAELASVAALALLACTAGSASAAQYVVDTVTDGLGNCAAAGQCTLRQALQSANLTAERDTVTVPAGTFDLTGEDLIVTMNDAVDISGAGAGATVLREVSGGDGRVLLLEQGSSTSLTGMTLTGSRGASAVLLFGPDVTLRGEGVTFTGNTAPRGAAIDGTGGSVTLERSAVVGNTATERGGGIHLGAGAARLTLVNSTVSSNTAPVGSGVSVSAGVSASAFSTIWGNTGAAGEHHVEPGAAATVQAAVVGSCSGVAPASLGGNAEPGGSCALAGPADRPGADLRLGPLAANGGSTLTHLPAAGSAAIDLAPGCPAANVDQRGAARPQGPACDAGAVETAAPPADAAAPVVGPLTLTRTRFRAAGRRTPLSATRAGTTLRFSVSEPAAIRATVLAARRGRRSGGRCAAPTRRLRRARPCTRWASLLTLRRSAAAAGRVSIAFSGRTATRTLRPGRHRFSVVATDTAGNASAPRAVSFTVVAR